MCFPFISNAKKLLEAYYRIICIGLPITFKTGVSKNGTDSFSINKASLVQLRPFLMKFDIMENKCLDISVKC